MTYLAAWRKLRTIRGYGFKARERWHALSPDEVGARWPLALCGALVVPIGGDFDPAHADACAICAERVRELA